MASSLRYGQLNFPIKFEECCQWLVSNLRRRIEQDVKENETKFPHFVKYSQFSICLPPLHVYPDYFKQQYHIQICDLQMRNYLKTAKVINWCNSVKSLYPVKTTADGNCLLHAISLFMWGIEDKEYLLRRLLYITLASDNGSLQRRWQCSQDQMRQNQPQGFNYNLTSVEIAREWEDVKKAAVDVPNQTAAGLPFQTLEDIHLFAMANILARPIIVLGEKTARSVFEQSLQDNHLYGIYLPLELDSQNTYRCPIIIGFTQNHFAPLVTHSNTPDGKGAGQSVLPLVLQDASALPVKFILPEEEASVQNLLKKYMKLKNIPYSTGSSITTIPGVITDYLSIYDKDDVVSEHRKICEQIFAETGYMAPVLPQQNPERWTQQISNSSKLQDNYPENRPCVTEGCQMFGTSETNYMCSDCLRKYTVDFNRREAELRGHYIKHEPSAPPLPLQYRTNSYTDISMIGENCQSNCGNKCSYKTFPYCHECYAKYNQAQPEEAALASISRPEEMPQVDDKGLFGIGENNAVGQNREVSGSALPSARKETKIVQLIDLERINSETNKLKCSGEKLGSLELPSMPSRASMDPESETFPMQKSVKKSLSSEGTPSPGQQSKEMIFPERQQQQQDILIENRRQESEQRSHERGGEEPFIGSSVEQSPLQSQELSKRLCAKAGCRGTRLDNNYGYCLKCWTDCFKTSEGNPQAPNSVIESKISLSTQEVRDMNPLVTSSKQKKICVSPLCNNKVYPPSTLCGNCIKILSDAYNARSRSYDEFLRNPFEERRTQSFSPPRPICIKPGCTFTGNSKFEGYCSSCFREEQIARAEELIRPTPPLSFGTATRSRPCVEPNCDRYGDPNMLERCTEHFRKLAGIGFVPGPPPVTRRYMTQSEVVRTNVGEKQPVGPNSTMYRPPGTRESNNTAPNETNINLQRQTFQPSHQRSEYPQQSTFHNAMTNVERQMKSPNSCKTRNCNNFGNPRNKGYCNSCFKWKQNQERITENGYSGAYDEHNCC